jgi:hypothetical protein
MVAGSPRETENREDERRNTGNDEAKGDQERPIEAAGGIEAGDKWLGTSLSSALSYLVSGVIFIDSQIAP